MKYLLVLFIVSLLSACAKKDTQDDLYYKIRKDKVVCTVIGTNERRDRYANYIESSLKCVFLRTERENSEIYNQRKKLESIANESLNDTTSIKDAESD